MNRPSLPRALLAALLLFECALSVGADEGRARHQQTASRRPIRHSVQVGEHPLCLWEKRAASATRSILLLHGRTWSGLPDFDLQVPGERRSLMDALVERGYATYALDLRGYGGTPRDESGWLSPGRAAEDLAAALEWIAEHDGIESRPALLGWSLGSTVAQLCVQSYPGKVSDLILFGYWYDPEQPIEAGGDPAEPERRANTAASAAADFITEGIITQTAVEAYVEACLAADPIRVDWRHMHEFNALDAGKVNVPTLLLQGEFDPYVDTRAHAQVFSDLGHADRQWVVVPGGDHAALLEDTQPAFVWALTSFLERPR